MKWKIRRINANLSNCSDCHMQTDLRTELFLCLVCNKYYRIVLLCTLFVGEATSLVIALSVFYVAPQTNEDDTILLNIREANQYGRSVLWYCSYIQPFIPFLFNLSISSTNLSPTTFRHFRSIKRAAGFASEYLFNFVLPFIHGQL